MSGKANIIKVAIVGDASSLSKSSRDAVSEVSKTGKALDGLKKSAGATFHTLGQTGIFGPLTETLDGIGSSIEGLGKKGTSLSTKLTAIGGGVAGVGLAATALGSKEKEAQNQLEAAVDATGKSYDDYEDKLERASKAQAKYGYTAQQGTEALTLLTQATRDPAEATKLLAEADDLAASRHENLGAAAEQLAKTWNGSTRLLKLYAIQALPSATAAHKKLETATRTATIADAKYALSKKKLAVIEAEDAKKKKLTASEADRLHNAQDGVTKAAQGSYYAHVALTAAQENVTKSAHAQQDTMDSLGKVIHGQADAAAGTFTGHLRALRAEVENNVAATGQKYGPALTGLGATLGIVGTLGNAAGAVIGKLTKGTEAATTATEAMAGAEDGAAVSEGLALGPILLIVGALAAVAAGAYLLYRNWGTIWGGIKAVAHDAATFIGDIPGHLGSAFASLGGILLAPFKAAFNGIAGLWNRTLGSISFKVPSWVPGIGGDGFSFPRIPTFHQGGIYSSGAAAGEGLAWLRDGEGVFTPQQMEAIGGGGTVVNNWPNGVTPQQVALAQRRYNRVNGRTS